MMVVVDLAGAYKMKTAVDLTMASPWSTTVLKAKVFLDWAVRKRWSPR
jgi:hypothetical protein